MKHNQNWLRSFLAILVLVSVLLIGWGANKGSEIDIYAVMLTIGSAFFGVSCGMYFEQLTKREQSEAILSTSEAMLTAINKGNQDLKQIILREDIFLSNQELIDTITGEWNHYNVSKKHGKYFWIHAVYDISSNSHGEISFNVTFKDNNEEDAVYQYSGFIRDDRVVFVGKPEKHEQPCFIQIWPHLTNFATEYHCGVTYNQSWDTHEMLIPCILSRRALINGNNINDDILDEMWKKGTKNVNLAILPRVT